MAQRKKRQAAVVGRSESSVAQPSPADEHDAATAEAVTVTVSAAAVDMVVSRSATLMSGQVELRVL